MPQNIIATTISIGSLIGCRCDIGKCIQGTYRWMIIEQLIKVLQRATMTRTSIYIGRGSRYGRVVGYPNLQIPYLHLNETGQYDIGILSYHFIFGPLLL